MEQLWVTGNAWKWFPALDQQIQQEGKIIGGMYENGEERRVREKEARFKFSVFWREGGVFSCHFRVSWILNDWSDR